jgi:L-alanine-DL-glutamate epimerase-like enolase superfamily enzyme
MNDPESSPSSPGLTRREFARRAGLLAGMSLIGGPVSRAGRPLDRTEPTSSAMPIEISNVTSNFEREPLRQPFGFKGSFMTDVWQTVALLESSSGARGLGLGTQNVLWSDAEVFASRSESGGNALMYALTDKALQLAAGTSFETPIALLDRLLPPVLEYGRQITGRSALRTTFALNALVAVDNAAWLLYAEENDLRDFDALVPEAYQSGLSHRHDRVASVPTFGYASTAADLRAAADAGYYIMKIKIGHPGSQEEMLRKDREWLSTIHEVFGPLETRHTESGKIPYYLDANGRYEDKETLRRFLDHADAIGAFDQILVLEEPFPEDHQTTVGDLGVNVAADESAHTAEDVVERIEMGYGSVALKPVAKTLSMTLKMAQAADERDTPCFCADLTVNPILVDWNKIVAARLAPLPGLETGLMETNGHQNYARWTEMEAYHPCEGAAWRDVDNGVFRVGTDFYDRNGCIFQPSEHYARLVQRPSSE